MNNETFFKAVNEEAGYEYVKNPEEQTLVKTREPIANFKAMAAWMNDSGSHSEVETSFGTMYTFVVHARELIVMDDGEFRYAWKD